MRKGPVLSSGAVPLSILTLQFLTFSVEIGDRGSLQLTVDHDTCLENVQRVLSSAHVSQLKSNVGDTINVQTSVPKIQKHQKTYI